MVKYGNSIRDAIKDLASSWINPTYAEYVSVPTQVKDLMCWAFVNGISNASEEGLLLLTAERRLRGSGLNGPYNKGDYFVDDPR